MLYSFLYFINDRGISFCPRSDFLHLMISMWLDLKNQTGQEAGFRPHDSGPQRRKRFDFALFQPFFPEGKSLSKNPNGMQSRAYFQ